MLNLHINGILGSVPVDKLDYRQITHWIRAMEKKGSSAKTIRVMTGARFGEATAVTVADVLFSCRWGNGRTGWSATGGLACTGQSVATLAPYAARPRK